MNCKKKNTEGVKKNYVFDVVFMVVFSALVILGLAKLIALGKYKWSVLFNWVESFDNSWIGISYSVVFLTTSLLSIFSDKEETVYWERFTEYVLVNPMAFNFLGWSCGAFVSIILETVALWGRDYGLCWASFIFGMFVIIRLYFMMSSIYFTRSAYIEKLKKERHENTELIDQLMEYTLFAADNHNGRIVEENISYLIQTLYGKDISYMTENTGKKHKETLYGSIEIREYAKRTLFDILSSFQDCKYAMKGITNNRKYLKNDEMLSDFIVWATQSNQEVLFWNFLAKTYEQVINIEYAKCREKFMDIIATRVDWYVGEALHILNFRKPNGRKEFKEFAKDYKNAIVLDDSEDIEQKVAESIKLIGRYEKEMQSVFRFFIANELLDEVEALITVVLRKFDLVEAKPSVNPSMDCSEKNILVSFLDSIVDNDEYICNFLVCYRNVVYTMHCGDIHYDETRDDAFARAILILRESKSHISMHLENIIEQFLIEEASDNIQTMYIMNMLMSDKPIGNCKRMVGNIFSYRTWLLTSCAELELDSDNQQMYQKEVDFWNVIIAQAGKSANTELVEHIKQLLETFQKENI